MKTVAQNQPEVTTQEIIQIPPEAMSLSRDPKIILAEAKRAATALKKVIDGRQKKLTFNGEQYLFNEDWLTVARFYGVTSRIRETRYVEYGDSVRGFEAVAEAYLVHSGQIISTGEAMCLSDEPKWNMRAKYSYEKGRKVKVGEEPVPLFQLKSMAQTRASSRVLRQVFAWVVVLAGYQPTPAEEMDNRNPEVNGVEQMPDLTFPCSDCGFDVTSGERDETRRTHGKTLCRVCKGKTAPMSAEEQENNAKLANMMRPNGGYHVNEHKRQAQAEVARKNGTA